MLSHLSCSSPRVTDVTFRFAGFVTLVVAVALQIQIFLMSGSTTRAYSANPYLLYVAFVGQILLQIWWLLCTPLAQASIVSDEEIAKEDAEPLLEPSAEMVATPTEPKTEPSQGLSSYIPTYIVGNLCISIWAAACHRHYFSLAQIILVFAITLQLYNMLCTLTNEYRNEQDEDTSTMPRMTLIVSKVFTGTCIMYLWMTWGTIDIEISPTVEQQIHSGIVFVLLTVASGSDPTTGLVFIYVLLSLFFGPHQNSGWHTFFLIQSGVQAALLVVEPISTKLNEKLNMYDTSSSKTRLPIAVGNDDENSSLLAPLAFQDELESASDVEDTIPMVPLRSQSLVEESGQVQEDMFAEDPIFTLDSDDSDSEDGNDEFPETPAQPSSSFPPSVFSGPVGKNFSAVEMNNFSIAPAQVA